MLNMVPPLSSNWGMTMKYPILIAATAVLALGARNEAEAHAPGAPPARTSTSDTASIAPAEPAKTAARVGNAALTADKAPAKEFMVGTWGEGDACEMPIKFEADGTIKDGPFEKWDLKDGYLMMEGAPQRIKLKVVDAKTMDSQLEGKTETRKLKRC